MIQMMQGPQALWACSEAPSVATYNYTTLTMRRTQCISFLLGNELGVYREEWLHDTQVKTEKPRRTAAAATLRSQRLLLIKAYSKSERRPILDDLNHAE